MSHAPLPKPSASPRTGLDPRAPRRAGRRAGWLLVALGVAILVPAGALLALILNWLPLQDLVPETVRVTGPVRATPAVFVWDALFLAVGAAALALGIRRVRSGAAHAPARVTNAARSRANRSGSSQCGE